MKENVHLIRISNSPQCYTAEDAFVSTKHWQKEIEAVYVSNGWLDINVAGSIYHVRQGEMIFINGGVTHYFIEKQRGSVIQIIKFTKEILINHFFGEYNKEAIKKLYDKIFMVHKDENVSRLIREMLHMNSGELSECYITAKLLELTFFLLSMPYLTYNEVVSEKEEDARYLDSILKYIDEHAENKITLQMLADYLGLTVCYCSKYIKQKTGMTFMEYLNGVRVCRAESLLINTKENITEIAYKTGFNSIQTFNRVFKNFKNMSPSKYRNLRQDKI